jgi:hypothetical protein
VIGDFDLADGGKAGDPAFLCLPLGHVLAFQARTKTK